MSNQIENLVRSLGVSVDEAKEIVEADRRIDKGEKLFELTPEQEKASKKARSVARQPTAYKFNKRERKADNDKRRIIQYLADALLNEVATSLTDYDCLAVTPIINNPEREIEFVYNDRKYRITLSCPRS